MRSVSSFMLSTARTPEIFVYSNARFASVAYRSREFAKRFKAPCTKELRVFSLLYLVCDVPGQGMKNQKTLNEAATEVSTITLRVIIGRVSRSTFSVFRLVLSVSQIAA